MARKDTQKTVNYADWAAFLADCAQAPASGWNGAHSVSGDAKWAGSANYQAALDTAWKGWPEGRSKMIAGVAAAPVADRHATHWLDVAGAYPMVPVAVAGDPACMVASGEETDPRGVVRLVIGGFYSAGNSRASIINRGVAVCTVIDAIEAAGQRVEVIWACWGSPIHGGTPYRINVTVKDASEPLDLDRMAFALANPAMFRRLGFRQVERHYSQADHGTSYGLPMTVKDDAPRTVVIQPMNLDLEDRFLTVASATKHVAAQFKAAGVAVEFAD